MTSLKDESKSYEPPQTLNVADLDRVPIDYQLETAVGKDMEGKEFTYKYIEVGGKQYRVPGSVLGGIKALLTKIPTLKFVEVIKSGSGMSTRYQVIPITE